MAPHITDFNDLSYVIEVFGNSSEDFLYTEFNVIDTDDVVYFGQLKTPKLRISLDQYTAALRRVPDEELFPAPPDDVNFTLAQDDVVEDSLYLKHPRVDVYSDYKEQNAVELLPLMLLEEAQALELVSRHPHPNIIEYHGCRVRRGRITALVLDRHPYNLKQYLQNGTGKIHKEAFMAMLESAVNHLHSLGLAHNDINPRNVMVDKAGMPVLIDFGSCRAAGQKLGASRGTTGWIQGESKDYDTSEKEHDLFALEKLRVWLEDSTLQA